LKNRPAPGTLPPDPLCLRQLGLRPTLQSFKKHFSAEI